MRSSVTARLAGLFLALLPLTLAATARAQGKGAARANAPEGDGEQAMGTWALVVFNTRPFEFPNTGGAPAIPLTIYTVGVRHWTTKPLWKFRNFGVDLGVGLAFNRSNVTQPQTGTLVTEDGPSTSGFGLHAGLPLAITVHEHAIFELVPEIDLIRAKETIPPLVAGGDTTEYTGWAFRTGVKAGFEIFFGFIGIPQLAVEAGVTGMVTFDSVKSTIGPIERSTRQWGFSTQRGTEPWSVFTGSVAAMYHF